MKSKRNKKISLALAAVMIIGVMALVQGCGGGGGGSAPATPAATTPTASHTGATGAGKVAAVAKFNNRMAGRSAGQSLSSSVTVNITISGVYSGDNNEFPDVTTSAVIDISQGSATVPVLDVPVGVNHLLVVEAVWSDGFTETLKVIIPEITTGVTTTVTADPASTALADAAIAYAEQQGIRLADLPDEYVNNMGVPAGLSINEPTSAIVSGNTFQFTGAVVDGNGTSLPSALPTYSFSDSAVGTIDAYGLFTALAAGSGEVTAAYNSLTATATVTVITLCAVDADCDDGLPLTLDTCAGAGTASAACVSTPIACNVDLDCNDGMPLTADTCASGGTLSAVCSNTAYACNTSSDCTAPTPVCLSGGGVSSACIACAIDTDCDDANTYTIDTCTNPGTMSAACSNATVACLTVADCDDADANTIDTCYNPGVVAAVCGHSTVVSSDVLTDATWPLAGSPYIITQQIAVNASATLTIDPGVELYFQSPAAAINDIFGNGYGSLAGIKVDGVLNAIGTIMSPILMTVDPATTPGPGAWAGIYFTPGSAGTLQYVNMEYPSFAIQISGSSPTIDNVNITAAGQPVGGASYHIFTKTPRGWVEQAVVHYNMRFESQNIDLSGLLPDADGEYKVRIQQQGMAAAQVDSVQLMADGTEYRAAMATDPATGRDAAYKLSYRDNDVFDAHEKVFDVRFDTTGLNYTPKRTNLVLTAREESKTALEGGHAFTYPRNNFYDDVNSARYYTYKLGENTGALRMDSEKTAADALPAPMFVERTIPMTGHPTGDVYGYVKNDGRYLYAALDFTPDNTYDGTADYATLYVRVGNALKAFRVSVPETRYGDVGFTYTDAVNYQHKYYEFKIPLSAIGNPSPGDSLQLVFDAYGTAALFYGVVVVYYAPTPLNISNLSIAIDPGAQFNMYGMVVQYSTLNAQNISIEMDPNVANNAYGMVVQYGALNGQNISIFGAMVGMAMDSATGSVINGLSVSDSWGSPGFYLANSSNVSISNCDVSNSYNSANGYVTYSDTVSFTNCAFNTSRGGSGAYIDNSTGVSFADSDFSFNADGGLSVYRGTVSVSGSRFHNNCYNGLYSFGDISLQSAVDVLNSNVTDNGSQAFFGDGVAYSQINLDGVYMSGNMGAAVNEVETDTSIPDSTSAIQQYFGITSLASQALTPNSVIPSASGTQATCIVK